MMNQAASAARRPAGSAATAGCCPIFTTPFFVNSFAPAPVVQATVPQSQQTQQCFLGQQQQPITHLPIHSSQATAQQELVIHQQINLHQQLQPHNNQHQHHHQQQHHHLQQLQTPPVISTTAPPSAQVHQQAQPLLQRTQDQSSTYNTSTTTPPFDLQSLLVNANRHNAASNCVALAAAAFASFHLPRIQQLQQLQQQQHQQQQQQQQQTPINQTTSNTSTADLSNSVSSNNVTATNQVPMLNFNGFHAAQPFLNLPAAPTNPHSTLNNNHLQPQTQQQQATHRNNPAVTSSNSSQPLVVQTNALNSVSNHPVDAQINNQGLPLYTSLPYMEQAIALLTNPQPGNIFHQLLNYFQNGVRAEPNHQHNQTHFHHHVHNLHHHHHQTGPNSQGNGQDVTVPLDSLAVSETKPRGLTRNEIDSLTPYIHLNEKDARTCVICLSKFELKSKIRPLPCNHAFHAKCVDKWLRANRTCPICRRDALKTYNAKIKRI